MKILKLIFLIILSFGIVSCSINTEEWQSVNTQDIQGSWFYRSKFTSLDDIESFINKQKSIEVDYSSFNYLDFETSAVQWYYADFDYGVIKCDLEKYSYVINNSKITITIASNSVTYKSQKYKSDNKTYMYLLKENVYYLFSKKANDEYKSEAVQNCDFEYVNIVD